MVKETNKKINANDERGKKKVQGRQKTIICREITLAYLSLVSFTFLYTDIVHHPVSSMYNFFPYLSFFVCVCVCFTDISLGWEKRIEGGGGGR